MFEVIFSRSIRIGDTSAAFTKISLGHYAGGEVDGVLVSAPDKF